MNDTRQELIEKLFEAFNRRDADAVIALCHDEVVFVPITAEVAGRPSSYVGHAGVLEYFADVEKVWDELLVTPTKTRSAGDFALILGRVYARSHDLGMRDLPVAWVYELREGRFVRGEIFDDTQAAIARARELGI